MDPSSSYEINDMYLMSVLSFSCLILFVVIKFDAPWSKESCLSYLVGVWIPFQLTALTLFSLQHSQRVELPQQLATSVNTILATTSLCGVAVIQIITIIYTFAVLGNEIWWKSAAALVCVEFALILIITLIPQVPTPVELAYILPFTSQAAAMGTIWASSRGIFRNRIQKHTADHLLGLGLITLLVSALLLPLSTLGYFRSQMTLQWVFFMVITTVAYRLPESSSNEPATTSASQIELTPMGGSCSMNEPPPESSPDLNERTSIRSRVALPPDSMRSVEHSSNKQDIDSSV
ncbi:Vacuolar calcium ion transporter [Fusarium oxysporum f. sp. albedinis]|nr:Vacuolar calcium ion transporter [Fusarium oxysporum f. sp. albedinis]